MNVIWWKTIFRYFHYFQCSHIAKQRKKFPRHRIFLQTSLWCEWKIASASSPFSFHFFYLSLFLQRFHVSFPPYVCKIIRTNAFSHSLCNWVEWTSIEEDSEMNSCYFTLSWSLDSKPMRKRARADRRFGFQWSSSLSV